MPGALPTLGRGFIVAVLLTAALGLAGGWAALRFVVDMQAAYARVQAPTQKLAWPGGVIEFVDRGAGPPVLVVHGSGGGFDQGLLLAEVALGEGFRTIVPSRFGYLGSTLPAGASFDDQANAFVALLDHLGLQRVAVVAFSHGGPSALLLAALHPERVSSLTLLSGGIAATGVADQAQADRQGAALRRIYQDDLRYWSITQLLRSQFLTLMGANAEVRAALTPAQRRLVDALVDGMNPVAPRAAGVAFDNQAALPGSRIAAIRAPTLLIHARDDTLQLHAQADYAVATIRGARLVSHARGGHLVLALQQPAVRAEVRAHLLAHLPAPDAAAGPRGADINVTPP